MKDEVPKLAKLLSVALRYPDARWRAVRPEMIRALEALPPGPCRDGCMGFLKAAQALPPLALEEIYTRIFDLNPAMCLHLTYHQCGQTGERGDALLGWQALYRSAGYECPPGELPDYFPMVLEFLSVCPAEVRGRAARACLPSVRGLADRIPEDDDPYGRLLHAASALLERLAGAPPEGGL